MWHRCLQKSCSIACDDEAGSSRSCDERYSFAPKLRFRDPGRSMENIVQGPHVQSAVSPPGGGPSQITVGARPSRALQGGVRSASCGLVPLHEPTVPRTDPASRATPHAASRSMTAALERVQSALAPRYLVQRELGAGGMAVVYLAEDPRHGRLVAVKVMRSELAAALGPERFLREIRIAARLRHPNIVPLYDSGEADGLHYYVMP
jgi:hypothetical protein